MPRPRGDRHRGRKLIPIVEGQSGDTKFRFVGGANPSSTITRPGGTVHWGSCEVGKLKTALPNTGPKGEYVTIQATPTITKYYELPDSIKNRQKLKDAGMTVVVGTISAFFILPIFSVPSLATIGGGASAVALTAVDTAALSATPLAAGAMAIAGSTGTNPQGSGLPAASGSKGIPQKSGIPPTAPLNTVKFTGFSQPCKK